MSQDLTIYYEGGSVNRFWLAPAGLSLSEAKKQRVGRRLKTREGARRSLLAANAAMRREENR